MTLNRFVSNHFFDRPVGKPEKPISVVEALKREAKEGSYWITEVSWRNYKAKTVNEFIPSLSKVVKIKLPPDLPKGYVMQCCKNWLSIQNIFFEAAMSPKDFEHLYQIEKEFDHLKKKYCLNIFHFGDLAAFQYPRGYSTYIEVKDINRELSNLKAEDLIKSVNSSKHCFAFTKEAVITLKSGDTTTDLDTSISHIDSISFKINQYITEEEYLVQ